MPPVRDREIRVALRRWLQPQCGCNGRVIEEFVLRDSGVRADVVLVNGALSAFEIKSEQDTLARLPKQQTAYAKCFDHVSLVTHPKHLDAARELIPRRWGIVLAEREYGGEVVLRSKRRALPRVRELDARALAELLRKEEVLQLLQHAGVEVTGRTTRRTLIEMAVGSVGKRRLLDGVREALKARDDSRFGATPSRRDGLFPSGSTSRDFHQNRRWLLSHRVDRRRG